MSTNAELRKRLLEMEIETLMGSELRGADRARLQGAIALLANSDRATEQSAETRAFTQWMRTGDKSAELRTANVMEIGEGSQGGFLVPQDWANTYQAALRSYSGLREAGATVVTKTTGQPFKLPFSNDTATMAQRLSESVPATDAIPTASVNSPTTFMYSGAGVRVSIPLFQDSSFDISSYLREIFAQRIAKTLNLEQTQGAGGGPSGVLPNITNTQTSAGASAITLADLNSLPTTIDYAYRNGAVYTFNANTEKYLKNLVATGSGERMFPEMADGNLNGFRYVVNVDFPDIAAGATAVAFGNFRRGVLIHDVAPIMVNSIERYAEKYERYYNLFQRSGVTITDANALAVLVQHA
jgi:HK97 family phage major capsid protein